METAERGKGREEKTGTYSYVREENKKEKRRGKEGEGEGPDVESEQPAKLWGWDHHTRSQEMDKFCFCLHIYFPLSKLYPYPNSPLFHLQNGVLMHHFLLSSWNSVRWKRAVFWFCHTPLEKMKMVQSFKSTHIPNDIWKKESNKNTKSQSIYRKDKKKVMIVNNTICFEIWEEDTP